jgi:hypothetical protein
MPNSVVFQPLAEWVEAGKMPRRWYQWLLKASSEVNAASEFSFVPRNNYAMSELYHECGVAAVYHLAHGAASSLAPEGGPNQVARLLPRMLQDIQNRGQLAAGIQNGRSYSTR